MKFIKNSLGGYFNLSQVEVFYIESTRFGNLYASVKARLINGDIYTLKDYELDPKSATQFDLKAEAQAWLDKFVSEINGD